MRTSSVLIGVAAGLLGLQSVTAVNIQSAKCRADPSRAAAVKAGYRRSYQAYLDIAAPADELQPLSKKGTGGFGGWGATMIDSVTTSFLMGHMDYYNQSVAYAEKVDFTTSVESASISLFETNIRYLGALLSAFELGGKQHPRLVEQAAVIGDHLLTGWVGDNDLPYNTLQDWNTFGAPKKNRAIIAETGTLIIELSRLSKYSGNPKYLDHAVRAMNATINAKQSLPKGLYGQGIDVTTGAATDDYATWGGGSDSFYEYLLKYGQLTGTSQTWIPAWVETVKAAVQYLITTSGGSARKLTYLTDYSPSSGGQIPRFSHLGCFAAGNFILGGKLLRSQAVFDYGIKLTEGCLNTYTASPTGLGPETFVLKNSNGSTNGVKINNPKFYQQNGFDFEARDYILRPEVLESVWYAYRTTGDRRWQDAAWRAFQQMEKYLVSDSGAWAGINDVTNAKFPEQLDTSQSFAYAETFKYIYLIFAEPNVASLDTYTFNTEGHPFLQDAPLFDYSSINVGALPSPQGGATPAPTKASDATPPLPKFSGMPAGSVQGEIEKALDGLVSFFGGKPLANKSKRAH